MRLRLTSGRAKYHEGGFAPNFTLTGLTDGHSGFMLDAALINAVNEHLEPMRAVDRATAMCGESPAHFLADGSLATGPIMAGLEQRKITGFVPVKSNEPAADRSMALILRTAKSETFECSHVSPERGLF